MNLTKRDKQRLYYFCLVMGAALLLIAMVSWLNANVFLEALADSLGSGVTLVLWLFTIAAGGIAAFFIRKTIWHVKTLTAIILLVIYACIVGLAFSALLLGVSWLTFILVLAVFVILAMLWNQSHALSLPGDSKRAVIIWALAVCLWIMMVLMFWCFLWGAWDTTNRRFSHLRRNTKG